MNWGRILGRIETKAWRVFLLFIHCYLNSFALRCKLLQTHATFYVFLQFSYWTLQRRKRGKPDRKTYPLPFGLRNPCINLKSENSQDYAKKPQRNSMFMNSTSVPLYCKPISAVGNSQPNSNPFLVSYKVKMIYVKNWGKRRIFILLKVKNEIQMIKLIQDLTNSVAAAVNGKTKVCFTVHILKGT
jgi:hypothetical protein